MSLLSLWYVVVACVSHQCYSPLAQLCSVRGHGVTDFLKKKKKHQAWYRTVIGLSLIFIDHFYCFIIFIHFKVTDIKCCMLRSSEHHLCASCTLLSTLSILFTIYTKVLFSKLWTKISFSSCYCADSYQSK